MLSVERLPVCRAAKVGSHSTFAARQHAAEVIYLNHLRKQDGDWPPRCRVAALPLCRVLCVRAIVYIYFDF